MVRLIDYIRDPWRLVVSQKLQWLMWLVPDSCYLKCRYWAVFYRKLDLKKPRGFNQKLQWLKLHDFRPEYSAMVDKFAAKEFVAKRIGEQYVIPTYGVWTRFDDIDFGQLPDRFVLKCTHDSSSVVICRDKAAFDMEAARKKLTHCLKRKFFYLGREYPYKYIKPQIIAEAYMEDENLHDLRDYKFFTFGGVPKLVHVVSNRQNPNEETYGDFFNMEYQHMDIAMGHNPAPTPPEKPVNFEKMKEFAAKLSQGTKHLRVDFYEVNGHLYFGELTFYQDAGWGKIEPPEWDDIMGDWIDL